MNKKVFGRKLSRSRPAREALFSALVRSLIERGSIVTTKAKAKAILPDIEKFVKLSKKGDLVSRRSVLSSLDNAKDAVAILFERVAPKFSARKSGFTKITHLARRKGDNSEMVKIEWIEKIEEVKKVEEKKKKVVKNNENVPTKSKRS